MDMLAQLDNLLLTLWALLLASLLLSKDGACGVELVTMTVYTPSCPSDAVYQQTVSLAAERFANASASVSFVINNIATCTEASELMDIVGRLNSGPNNIIVGPNNLALCEVTANILSANDVLLASWTCTDASLSKRTNYKSLMRSVASSKTSGDRLADFLRYFEWKRVMIIMSHKGYYLDFASDIYVQLSKNEFIMKHFTEIEPGETIESLHHKLQTIDDTVKAVILCLRDEDIELVLVAASRAGLADGKQALFLVQSGESLQASLSEGVLVTLPATLNPHKNDSQDLQKALAASFILHAHPSSLLINTTSLQNYASLDENLYNSMVMAMTSVRLSVEAGNGTTGASAASFSCNQTFDGLVGPISTDNDGVLDFYFSLWDYDPGQAAFRLVIEAGPSGGNAITIGASISWPYGVALSADTCEFTVCEGFSLKYIVSVIVVAVCIVGAAIGSVVFFRHRLSIKEMEKGPNKIVLNSDDLTFVSPKSIGKSKGSFKSNSMFEKPDLLKASEPSLSVNSFNEQFGDITETARYNGDLVYVKELSIKGFEMKGKLRTFLKTLRDLRHENLNPFIGCFIGPLRPAFVWEYCNRKSLEDVINNEDIKLDWDFKFSLLTDLVKGIRYIHGSVLRVHGNLKSGNCVIDSRWVLKLTDYGENVIYDKYQTKRELSARELLWTAPELLRDEALSAKGTSKADIYSFGIIMQEVIVRGHPFCMLDLNPEEIVRKVRKPPPMCRPSVSQGAAPPQYIQIMKQCWAEMPDMRPDMEHIYQQFKELNRGKKMNIVDTMFKMLEKYSTDLEDIVKDRTVALEDEKKKTEHLLSQMLPASVAESLLLGRPVEAVTYEEVTIYFSDIVGFTTISAMSSPMQVVDLLNDLYTMFDSTIDNYDVYKVETIGDAYMVVSGLPEVNGKRHAGEVSTMALDLLSGCGQFKIRHMPEVPLRLRIGLHSGPCVAGVVGLRMPRYCLFGDTVNTASRLESTGLAFRVHLSQQTKDILDILGGYKCDCRGETELKGKGKHKTYWLVGKEGFTKQIPEPPDSTSGDNHGLAAYEKDLDKLKAKALENAKLESERNKPVQKEGTQETLTTQLIEEVLIENTTGETDKTSQGCNNNNRNNNTEDGEGRALHRDSAQSIVTTGSKRSEASPSPINIEEK